MEEKIYTPEPLPGPISSAIGLVSDTSIKAEMKARALAELSKVEPWTEQGVTFSITSGPSYNPNRNIVEVVVYAERDGIPLPLDNPYQFYNPPLKVHDGTYHKNIELNDVPNFAEDVLSSLHAIVVDSVLQVAYNKGWK